MSSGFAFRIPGPRPFIRRAGRTLSLFATGRAPGTFRIYQKRRRLLSASGETRLARDALAEGFFPGWFSPGSAVFGGCLRASGFGPGCFAFAFRSRVSVPRRDFPVFGRFPVFPRFGRKPSGFRGWPRRGGEPFSRLGVLKCPAGVFRGFARPSFRLRVRTFWRPRFPRMFQSRRISRGFFPRTKALRNRGAVRC
jgi:hypothetical protein